MDFRQLLLGVVAGVNSGVDLFLCGVRVFQNLHCNIQGSTKRCIALRRIVIAGDRAQFLNKSFQGALIRDLAKVRHCLVERAGRVFNFLLGCIYVCQDVLRGSTI